MSNADPTVLTTRERASALAAPVIPEVTIERELGRGGMGAVWLGRQTYLDRPVAVKALLAVADASFAARFRREATILAGLHHPHIVACHSAGIAPDGRPFLVMEFVDGPDLKAWIAGHGRLPPAIAARLVREVAEGLAHAHAQGIIHRDVKPENILLARSGSGDVGAWTAKLADLGLARPAKAAGTAANLTQAGQVVGTPATMAPEQFDDPEGVDHRADIYGLGCVLYHALTGSPAFTGGTFAAIVASKVHGQAPDPQLVVRGIPPRLAGLCARMLASDRTARPQDYAAVISELRACEGEVAAGPATPRRMLAFGAVLAGFGGLALWLALRPAGVAPTVPVPTSAPATAASAVALLPPLTAPQQLFEEEYIHRLNGWEIQPGAMWSGADEREGRAVTGRDGWISRPLPGLPLRLTATIEVPAAEGWDWWLAGVRLADGQLVAVRAINLDEFKAAIETRRTADPLATSSTSTLPSNLRSGGGKLRLDLAADRLSAVIDGVSLGEVSLASPPVALVFAGRAQQAIIVLNPVAAPPGPAITTPPGR